MNKQLIAIGAFLGTISVILGATAAHYLKTKVSEGIISPDNLSSFETGVKFQMYHSLLLILISLLYDKVNFKLIKLSSYCIIIGTACFSFSIYFLSLSNLLHLGNLKFLGPITPIGGILLIIGWILLGLSALIKNKGK